MPICNFGVRTTPRLRDNHAAQAVDTIKRVNATEPLVLKKQKEQ